MTAGWEFSPERLREQREARGFSRPGLARRMGIRAEAIKNWEIDNNRPSVDNLSAVATALSCEPGVFFRKRET